MAKASALAFDENGSFAINVATFEKHLAATDAVLAPAIVAALPAMPDGKHSREAVLNNLMDALIAAAKLAATMPGATPTPLSAVLPPAAAAPLPTTAPVGWFLEKLEIEGFRGINNKGAPLTLVFKADSVTSISAPNGVGKSSIFDALPLRFRAPFRNSTAWLRLKKGKTIT